MRGERPSEEGREGREALHEPEHVREIVHKPGGMPKVVSRPLVAVDVDLVGAHAYLARGTCSTWV